MENKDLNIMPHIELFPKLAWLGRKLGGLCVMHQLSEVSDHKFDHPLDDVFDKPPYADSALLDANLSGFGYETEE